MTRPLGCAIVGCGMIARFHARALAEVPGARLAAVVSRRRDGADKLLAEVSPPPPAPAGDAPAAAALPSPPRGSPRPRLPPSTPPCPAPPPPPQWTSSSSP